MTVIIIINGKFIGISILWNEILWNEIPHKQKIVCCFLFHKYRLSPITLNYCYHDMDGYNKTKYVEIEDKNQWHIKRL